MDLQHKNKGRTNGRTYRLTFFCDGIDIRIVSLMSEFCGDPQVQETVNG